MGNSNSSGRTTRNTKSKSMPNNASARKSASSKVASAKTTKRPTFRSGDRVTWTHPPTQKSFVGQVIATVPAGFVIGAAKVDDVRDRLMQLSRTRNAVMATHRARFHEAINRSVDQIGSSAPRDHTSYLVCSAEGRLHWPDVNWLSRGRGRPTRNIQSFLEAAS